MAPRTLTAPDLPPGVVAADMKYPETKYNRKTFKPIRGTEVLARDHGDHGQLTFYNVRGFGWCIGTLHIRNQSTRARQRHGEMEARTYAVRVSDGGVVRIGLGPHVVGTVSIYIRESRVKDLQKYIDLYNSGSESAHQIRDRISTRRARGELMRREWM